MEDRSPPPLDEDEIREALAAALTEQAPPALVRFVGKPAYSRCDPRRNKSRYQLPCRHVAQCMPTCRHTTLTGRSNAGPPCGVGHCKHGN